MFLEFGVVPVILSSVILLSHCRRHHWDAEDVWPGIQGWRVCVDIFYNLFGGCHSSLSSKGRRKVQQLSLASAVTLSAPLHKTKLTTEACSQYDTGWPAILPVGKWVEGEGFLSKFHSQTGSLCIERANARTHIHTELTELIQQKAHRRGKPELLGVVPMETSPLAHLCLLR